jgi:RND family efflux transporter MFP subunit
MSKLTNPVVIGGLSVLVIAGIVTYMTVTYQDRTSVVPTTKIEQGKISSAIQATGVIDDSHQMAVLAAGGGQILTLDVQPGTEVKAGTVIAKLDGYELAEKQVEAMKKKIAYLKELAGLTEQKAAAGQKAAAAPVATAVRDVPADFAKPSYADLQGEAAGLLQEALQLTRETERLLSASTAHQAQAAAVQELSRELEAGLKRAGEGDWTYETLSAALRPVISSESVYRILVVQAETAPGTESTGAALQVQQGLKEQLAAAVELSSEAVALEAEAKDRALNASTQAALAQAQLETEQRILQMQTQLQGDSEAQRQTLLLSDKQSLVQVKQSLVEAELELQRAEELLKQNQLTAPVDGVVMKVNKKKGDRLAPGEELCVIVPSNAQPQVVAYVTAQEIAEVEVGKRVRIESGYFEGHVEGTVKFVSSVPRQEPNSTLVQYPVYIEAARLPEQAKLGMPVKISIETETVDDVLVVPVEAIMEEDGKRGIYVQTEDGKFEFRPVEIGKSDEKHVEVKSGDAGTVVALKKP